MGNAELEHRLNRVIGQLNAIKKILPYKGAGNCGKTVQQLKAAINALKKFGETYVKEHIDDCFSESNFSREKKELMQNELIQIISHSFSL